MQRLDRSKIMSEPLKQLRSALDSHDAHCRGLEAAQEVLERLLKELKADENAIILEMRRRGVAETIRAPPSGR
jgi:hypothetical protein